MARSPVIIARPPTVGTRRLDTDVAAVPVGRRAESPGESTTDSVAARRDELITAMSTAASTLQ